MNDSDAAAVPSPEPAGGHLRAGPTTPAIAAYGQELAEVAVAFASDFSIGLTEAEAALRLERFGRNELAETPPTPAWRRFLAQFREVMVVLLLVATAISAGLWALERDTSLPYEAMAIFAVVVLNAAMGYLQESRAAAAVAALRAMNAALATVLRGGQTQRVAAALLVPGDLMLLEEGDTIAADGRVVESTALRVAEATLTGESLPVSKHTAVIAAPAVLGDRHNMVWSGTTVSYGRGRVVVTATGMATEVGHIAGLLSAGGDRVTPLQRELARVAKVLGVTVIVIAAVMIVTILAMAEVHSAAAFIDVLILGVALAVAAVPEGLPTVVTAVLSIGVHRLARRHAIVRHLAAVEALGSASVIASDKTGTLTKNEMTVRVVVTASGSVELEGSGYDPSGEVSRVGGGALDGPLRAELEAALAAADRANNATVVEQAGRFVVHGDPTEAALVVAARKIGIDEAALERRLPRVGEVPFSSARRLMSTVHRDGGQRFTVFTKGAPDMVLARCTHELVGAELCALDAARRAAIASANEALADRALRTLGVAFHWLPADALSPVPGVDLAAQVEHDLVFAGLIGMIDPPRPEAAAAVASARRAGIRPLMITGDHPRTAAVIARELGISSDARAVTGVEIEQANDDELAKLVADVAVFARVDPAHKLRIVQALQRQGAVVAMTGDGVNDAPALEAADIGVAMGLYGTDVARQAADIVLADDNFATIVAAVEEGRTIFANLRKFLRFLLSSNIGEVLTMFFGVLLADHLGLVAEGDAVVLPLLATQLLWINLVTDGAPALALGVDPSDEAVMRDPPRCPSEGAITARMWRGIAFVGLVMAAGTLMVLDASLPGGFVEGAGELAYGQTMAFTTLMLFQICNVFNARSDESSAFRGLFTNSWLWAAVAGSLVLQVWVIYLPALQQAFGTVALSGADWLRCAAVASSVVWLREANKLLTRLVALRRTPAV